MFPDARPLVLTPTQERLLEHLARCPILSREQLARLVGMSDKGARRQLRPLFDGGLVSLIPVGRAALAGEDVPNDARLLFGSAPNVYQLTTTGRDYARGTKEAAKREKAVPAFGPKNALFLRHEISVGQVYVWLRGMAQVQETRGHALSQWHSGHVAFELQRKESPRLVCPDAWFVYQVGPPVSDVPPVVVGLVERDRGTERLGERWREKLAAYAALFSGDRLRAATGYANARVLVIAPDTLRRDRLAQYIAQTAPVVLQDRVWCADASVLENLNPHHAGWLRVGSGLLRPLFPPPAAPP